jgi:uncharacterized protein
MKIGLLSDTHGHLPDEVFDHFKDCDEIWHAGDIGSMEVINKLKAFKFLRAVYGNIDDLLVRKMFPENLYFNCESIDILLTHIGGSPPNYNKRTKELLQQYSPQIFICGHSHILKIEKDIKRGGMLFINPGAAGIQGFHKHKTLVKFVLERGQISNLQVIDLGKRG